MTSYDKAAIGFLAFFYVFVFCSAFIDAYTISHNRVIFVPSGVNATISRSMIAESNTEKISKMASLTIPKETIAELFDCHAKDGTISYQSGYDDACDWMREKIGIKRSSFKSRPSVAALPNVAKGGNTMISFPIRTGGYISLNASEYRVEYLHDHSPNWPKSRSYWPDSQILNDEWRIYPAHKTVYRPKIPESGIAYEDIENGSG